MSRKRIVDANQTVNTDLFRRAGLWMVRKKIKKFFLYVILLELKNSYKVNCA